MGTSLSGLTPATTFDGLLKVGDNDPLTATLKPISTGDGTDTMLELSTSALQIGGATGMYWDNTNKRLGIGTVAPSVPFEVYGNVRLRNSVNINGNIFNSASGIVNIEGLAYFNGITDKVGIGESTPTSRLHIKGSGATSATTSLLVQNSSGSESLTFSDDGVLTTTGNIVFNGFIGNSNGTYSITPNASTIFQIKSWQKPWNFVKDIGTVMTLDNDGNLGLGNSTDTNTARLHVKGAGNTSADYALKILNSDDSTLFDIRNDSVIRIAPNSTNAVSFRNAKMQDGNAVFGTTTIPASTRMTIKGQGATSATTSLLVQDSAGTDLLKVSDDGRVLVDEYIYPADGTTNSRFRVSNSVGTYMYYSTGNLRVNPSLMYTSTIYGTVFSVSNTTGDFSLNGATGAKMAIKGNGATSATTSLLVQNSANNIFSVRDDGALLFYRATNGAELLRIEDTGGSARFVAGNNADKSLTLGNNAITSAFSSIQFKTYDGASYSEVMRITGNTDQFVGIGEPAPTARLHVKAGTTQDSIAKFEDPRATTDYIEIKNDSTLTDYTGLYWGTSVKIRSKQTGAIFLDCTSGILFANGNSSKNKIDGEGNMSIGTPTIPASTRLTIKGQGATSATTSLLVENSAGTELIKVLDDGQLAIKSNSGGVSTTSGTSIFSYTSGGGGVLDVNPSNGNSVKFRARGDNDIFLIQTNPAGDNVGIGASSPDSTAKLQVDSTTQGFLPPRMTGTQRDAIESPASGLIIYNTTTNKAQCYNGTSWNDMF